MLLTRKTLTVNQAAAYASVSRRTIYAWMAAGKVEWVTTAGGSRRIFADTLLVGYDSDAPHDVEPLRAHDLAPFPVGPLVPKDRRREVMQTLARRCEAMRMARMRLGTSSD